MSTEARSDMRIIKRVNDAVYEFYKPEKGYVELDIVFFHGLHHDEPHWETWMLADNSACWLHTWLPEAFPQSRILSVSYDSIIHVSEFQEPTDMYLVGENLAQSIILLAGVGQRCPVVFVGHCVGGLVLKEVCLRAERMGAYLNEETRCGLNPYKTFLKSMKGAFFFSTPSLGSLVLGSSAALKQRAPLVEYVELLSKETSRLTSQFASLRRKFEWKTAGVSEANKTISNTSSGVSSIIRQYILRTPTSSMVVEEASARLDLDDFCVLAGEDYISICKPKHRSSNNFLLLVDFVRGILQILEAARQQWISFLQFPLVYVHMPARLDSIMDKLQLGEAEPSRVSIVGVGGVGKTTLAKEVLMHIASEFKYTCFIEDVAKKLAHCELHALVAENLYSGSGLKVWLPNGGDAQSMWLHLKGQLVLMILDNVDSEEQISPLLRPDWCGRGSRLIVTSRVRSRALLPTFAMCEVPVLTMEEARNLFLAHVQDDVLEDTPKSLIERIVKKCDGLPLTVVVIGSYLRFEKNLNIWNGALKKLERAESVNGSENDILWAKLRVSFDDLAPLERGMFLDLAVLDDCDPHYEQYDLPVWKAVWKSGSYGSSMYIGLRNLEERSFICIKKVTKYSRTSTVQPTLTVLLIHEQLRDMGKSISRPTDQQRIQLCRGVWQQDDVELLLSKYKGQDAKTEVLSVALEQTGDLQMRFRWGKLAQLQELRLLRMANVTLVGNTVPRFPSKLTFLHMTSCAKGTSKRFRFLENDCWPLREEDTEGLHFLTVLVLESCIPVCLPNNFHLLRRLTILIIRGKHFKKLPREFGLLPALKHLYLENVGLSKLPDSFSELPCLESLKLTGCSALKSWMIRIPRSVPKAENTSSPLCRLERLKLEDLQGFTELPESLGLLNSLQYVGIVGCSAVRKLPEGLGKLSDLRELEIRHCSRLDRLPNSLGELKALESLTLQELSISSLPDSVGNLQKLTSIVLRDLYNIRWLPETLGHLNDLQNFLIADCQKFEKMPESFAQLKELSFVDVNNCASLDIVPNSIGRSGSATPEINIQGCKSIRLLPECLGRLKVLRVAGASGAQILRRLERIELQQSLGTENLENIPDYLGHFLPANIVPFAQIDGPKLSIQFILEDELNNDEDDNFIDQSLIVELDLGKTYHFTGYPGVNKDREIWTVNN